MGRAIATEVLDDGVASTVIVQEIDGTNLDETFDLITNEDFARDRDGFVASLVPPGDLGLDAEDERDTSLKRLGLVVPLKPLLRLEDTNRGIISELNDIVRLPEHLESVLEVVEATTIEE